MRNKGSDNMIDTGRVGPSDTRTDNVSPRPCVTSSEVSDFVLTKPMEER